VSAAFSNKVLIATLGSAPATRATNTSAVSSARTRVIGFRCEPRPDGAPTWDLYLTPGKQQEERDSARGTSAQHTPADASTSNRP
jgi:hypothetical protein